MTIEGLQIGGGQTQTGPGGGVHACNAQGLTIRDCMITANTSSGSGDGIPDDCDCAADFDIDGNANTLDVLVFLNLWTAGC